MVSPSLPVLHVLRAPGGRNGRMQLPALPRARLPILRPQLVLPRCLGQPLAPGSTGPSGAQQFAALRGARAQAPHSALTGQHSPLCVWVSVLAARKNNVTLLSGSSSEFLGGINSFLVPASLSGSPSLALGTGCALHLLNFLHFLYILVRHVLKLTLYFPQLFSPR